MWLRDVVKSGYYGNDYRLIYNASSGGTRSHFESHPHVYINNLVCILDFKRSNGSISAKWHTFDGSSWSVYSIVSQWSDTSSVSGFTSNAQATNWSGHSGWGGHHPTQCICGVYINDSIIDESNYLESLKDRWSNFY